MKQTQTVMQQSRCKRKQAGLRSNDCQSKLLESCRRQKQEALQYEMGFWTSCKVSYDATETGWRNKLGGSES